MKFSDLFKEFAIQYKNEVNMRYSGELESFKLLVNKAPDILNDWIQQNQFEKSFISVKGSIGQGNNTYYPWLAIFDKRVSAGATNGYYIVILISDDFEDLYLTLNQGSTVQSKEISEKNKEYIYSLSSHLNGFIKGRIPQKGLVKTKEYSANNNGRKYEETNIFYRKYLIKDLEDEDFYENLKTLLTFYQTCASKFAANTTKQFTNFNLSKLVFEIKKSNIIFSPELIKRFASSLATKPFLILTGLAGSGKTMIALSFSKWLCANQSQYKLIPVGADWTNREPLLGYPNALETDKYIKPDNGALDLIIEASKKPNLPFFLILDEMNLSHVERYFADFLSAMESKESIPLHSNNNGMKSEDGTVIPPEIILPENLFIIGTVNIDETTYMFSPKVLDRAGVIEFRLTKNEMEQFLKEPVKANINAINGKGASMAFDFLQKATKAETKFTDKDIISSELIKFFGELKTVGAEFGYRTASEIFRYVAKVKILEQDTIQEWSIENIIDTAVCQKLLPKLHGSRKKLTPTLLKIASFCVTNPEDIDLDNKENKRAKKDKTLTEKYPISFDKICRMYDRAIQDGFTSFAEA